MKHKRGDGNNTPHLKSEGVHSDPVDKANILNNQFKKPFSPKSDLTDEQLTTRCTAYGKYPTIPDINITTNGIQKLLNSNPHKAAGHDNITPQILKELSAEITLTIIFIYTCVESPSI
jgi:hypothetical protein